jgi:hypothetical protein
LAVFLAATFFTALTRVFAAVFLTAIFFRAAFLGLAVLAAAGCVFVAPADSARTRAQRALVAAMIAFLPAAESFRFFFGVSGVTDFKDDSDCLLDKAHRFFCASPIRFRAAALSFRRLRFCGSGVAAVVLGPPSSMARSSLICESMCRFRSSKPWIAAVTISFVSLRVGMILFFGVEFQNSTFYRLLYV